MPGEISAAECKVLEDGVKELEAEYVRLWQELVEISQRIQSNGGDLQAARDEYQAALLEVLTVATLRDNAMEQLQRCRQRVDADCSDEVARVGEFEGRLQEAMSETEAARQRVLALTAEAAVLGEQWNAVREEMWTNGDNIDVRQQRIKDGHCYRFKKN